MGRGIFTFSSFCHDCGSIKSKIFFFPPGFLLATGSEPPYFVGAMALRDTFFTENAFQMGIKTIVASSLALLVAQASHLFNGYWILVTVMILSNASPILAWQKSVGRIIGTLAGSLMAVVVSSVFVQSPVWLVIIIFSFMVISGYGSFASEYPYAFTISGVTFLFIIYTVMTNPANLFNVAFYRTFDIILGITISWVVNQIFWPRPYRQNIPKAFRQSIVDIKAICAAVIRRLEGEDGGGEFDYSALSKKNQQVIDLNMGLLANIRKSSSLKESSIDHFIRISTGLKDVLFKIDFLIDLLEVQDHVHAVREMKADIAQRYASVVKRLDHVMFALGPVVDGFIYDPVETVDTTTYRRLYEFLRERRLVSAGAVTDDLTVIETLRTFESMEESLYQLQMDIQEHSYAEPQILFHPRPLYYMMDHLKGHLRSPDAHALRHGIKIGLAVLIGFYIYYATKWSGSFLMIITIIIVMQPNLGSGLKMMVQWTGGAVIGAFVGLFYVTAIFPSINSMGALLLVLAPFFYIIGWGVAERPNQVAVYIDMGIILGVSVFGQQYAAPADLARFFPLALGVIAGSFIGSVVNYFVWPIQARGMLLRKLHDLVHDSREISAILLGSYAEPVTDFERVRIIRTQAQMVGADATKLLADAQTELTGATLDLKNVSRLISLLRALPIHLTVAGNIWQKCMNLDISRNLLREEFHHAFDEINNRMISLEKALDKGCLPPSTTALDESLAAIESKIVELKKDRGRLILDPSDFAKFVLLRQTLFAVSRFLNQIDSVGELHCAPAPAHHVLRKAFVG